MSRCGTDERLRAADLRGEASLLGVDPGFAAALEPTCMRIAQAQNEHEIRCSRCTAQWSIAPTEEGEPSADVLDAALSQADIESAALPFPGRDSYREVRVQDRCSLTAEKCR